MLKNKSKKFIQIFTDGSLRFEGKNSYIKKFKPFLYKEKDLKNLAWYKKSKISLLKTQEFSYRKKYF